MLTILVALYLWLHSARASSTGISNEEALRPTTPAAVYYICAVLPVVVALLFNPLLGCHRRRSSGQLLRDKCAINCTQFFVATKHTWNACADVVYSKATDLITLVPSSRRHRQLTRWLHQCEYGV